MEKLGKDENETYYLEKVNRNNIIVVRKGRFWNVPVLIILRRRSPNISGK